MELTYHTVFQRFYTASYLNVSTDCCWSGVPRHPAVHLRSDATRHGSHQGGMWPAPGLGIRWYPSEYERHIDNTVPCHAGRPQITWQRSPRLWIRHAGRPQLTIAPWLWWEAIPLEAPHCHVPIARGAVTNTSIASFDLQTFIDPLPLDQLLCYSPSTVHSWPAEDRDQILAVANRDMTIARRNVAELTRYPWH